MIEVSNLSKYFVKHIRGKGLKGMIGTLFSPKKETIKAVDDISFTINDGEIVGYIGSNGAGKSTTIKMMSGILTPTNGYIKINGMEPYGNKTRKKVLKDIGVVFGQRTQLWWDLPLTETFSLYKEIYEISDEEFNERFDYLVDILDAKSFLNQPVRTLSLGQRMRADLMAALIHNPKTLFLDEPTIGLDVLVKERIITAIKEINKKYKTTVILTTHDMSDIKNLCHRVIILDSGKILYDGELDKIKKKFGDIRNIYILYNEMDKINCEEINKKYHNSLTFDHDEKGYLKITYDADKILTQEILSYLLSLGEVKDVGISENSLEKIVKKIYASKTI